MRRCSTLSVALVMAGAGIGLAGATANRAVAGEYKQANIVVKHPWSRATPGGAPIGAGYMTITNNGKTADRLLGGASTIAKRVEVHTMTMVKGVMRMRKLVDGLVIKPGQTVKLAPGGDHLMLIGLTKPIRKGQPFAATLNFAKAGKLTVSFKVEAIGAMGHEDGLVKTDRGSGAMTPSGGMMAPMKTMPMKKMPMKTMPAMPGGMNGHGGSGSHTQ